MTTSRRSRDIVRRAYDRQAEEYARSRDMQNATLDVLLARLREAMPAGGMGCVLDVGSGTIGGASPAWQRVRPSRYVSIDLSLAMLRQAQDREGPGERAVADAATLPFRDRSFDVVCSNSVLHWLNVPESGLSPEPAFREVARVLRPNGWFAFSISGAGTARAFLTAYHTAMRVERRRSDFRVRLYRRDPIGSMELHEVVDGVSRAGLAIESAELAYAPVPYGTPREYCDVVRAYGFGIYLAPVPEKRRLRAWVRIVEEFERLVGSGPYLHDQFLIYILGRRAPRGSTFRSGSPAR